MEKAGYDRPFLFLKIEYSVSSASNAKPLKASSDHSTIETPNIDQLLLPHKPAALNSIGTACPA